MSRAPDALSGREFCCLPGPGALGIQLCTSAAHDGQRYNSHQRAVIGNAGPPTGAGSIPATLDRFEGPAQRGGAANALHHDAHHAAADIDASYAFVETLAGKDDDEILASLLGEDHGGEMRGGGVPIALGPQLHRDFAFVSGPVASMLEHGGADRDGGNGGDSGDAPDSSSGVDTSTSSKVPDFSWIMEAAMRSMKLQDDEKDTNSQDQQPVTTAVDTKILPPRKRTRQEGSDEDEALSEKKRRVPTEQQPGSPAAFRLPVGAAIGATNNAGSSTAATRTSIQFDTAAATAPFPETKGVAVVEPTAPVANGVHETPIVLPLHSALQVQAVAPSAGLGWSADRRRIKRAAILAAITRERAAAAVRAALAAELSPRRRGKAVRGRGKGMAKARV